MLLRHLIGKRLKVPPAEAVLPSHSILLRGGYLRQVANGIYSLLPLGLRVVKKIEGIIREEMDAIGVQFADADLIGAPLRLTFSKKNIGEKRVEWKRRGGADKGVIDLNEVVGFVSDLIRTYS